MKKQISLLAILLLGLVTTAWASNWSIDVMVGSEQAAPSLVFGEIPTDEEEVVKPFPPFSGMFGVKDVYLANPANFDDDKTNDVSGDFERLGTDIRKCSEDNKWVIVANSDATLYFSCENWDWLPEGGLTAVGTVDDKTVKTAIVEGSKLSVKQGVCYTIYQGEESVDPIVPEGGSTETTNLEKDDKTGTYSSEVEENVNSTEIVIQVISPGAEVYVKIGTVYYGKGNATVKGEVALKGWVLSFSLTSSATRAENGINVDYANDGSITVSSTSNVETLYMTSETQNGSLDPIQTNLSYTDSTTSKEVTRSFIQTITQDGTLDFDGDGNVDINDATFFYNYVSVGGADLVDEIIYCANAQLTDDLEGDAKNALDYFKGMDGDLQALSLVEADTINEISDLSDSATFFYNNESIGGADLPGEITAFTSREKNTEQDLKDAQEALDRINELKQ